MKKSDLREDVIEKIDCLHFHNLCENLSDDSISLISHISENFKQILSKVSSVNFGGGHYITHKDYDLDKFSNSLIKFKQEHNVSITLEPGGAIVYDTGYLVSEVEDIVENEIKIAILNTSATCHMPDVLEVPYQPDVIEAKISELETENTYLLTGKTCLTGDVIGKYNFKNPLNIGDKVIFKDMMQYSFVKNNSFNGMPLPDLGILMKDGKYKIIKSFKYEDFKNRLS